MLDLKLVIEAEHAQAKRALAEVEAGIKKVESAAKGTADPLSKVTSTIDGLADSSSHLTKEVAESNEAWLKNVSTMGSTQRMADSLKTSQTGLMATTNALAASVGLSSTALVGLATGLAAAGVASVAFAAVLAQSTRHYFEHSKATKDSRDALNALAKSWDDFQMMVGGAVLGSDFTIAKPVQALNAALLVTGAYLAERIDQSREWLDMLLRINGMLGGRTTGLPFGGDTPDIASQTFSGQGLAMWRNSLTAGQWIPTSAGSAQSEWDRFARELDKAREKAERAAQRWADFLKNDLPGVIPGISGTFPAWTRVDLPEWAATGIAPRAGLIQMAGGGTGVSPADFYGSVPVGVPELWSQIYSPYNSQPWTPYESVRPSNAQGQGFWSRNFNNPFQRGNLSGSDYAMNLYGTGMALYGGAQDVWAATSQGGAGRRALAGAGQGAQVGMMFGPWGAAIGAGVGALVGAVRGWLAPTEYELRTRQQEKDRASAAHMLAAPGLERLWGAAGGNVPFGFDFLKTQAFHDPTAVKGYLDEMLAKTERLQSAMEKYGISWEELGAKAKQSQVDMMAEELIQDFDVLMGAGADVNLIIERMGGSINDFVQSALRTGSEVPSAMQPMLQKMIDMGLLTDENGKAFGSLEETGITFAKTMTQGFDAIVEAINRVAKGLGVDIPEAIDKIPPRVTIDVDYSTAGNDTYEPDGGYPPAAHRGAYVGWSRLVPAYHRGGEVLARLQPGEFVMQRSAVNQLGLGTMRALNSGRGGLVTTPIVLQIDGRTVTEVVAQRVLVG